MKKLLSILLSIQLLLSACFFNSNFEEMIKLAQLVEHYQFHRMTDDPGLDFWSFVRMHYFQKEDGTESSRHHQELPFQQFANTGFFLSFPAAYLPEFIPQALPVAVVRNLMPGNDKLQFQSFIPRILKPPVG